MNSDWMLELLHFIILWSLNNNVSLISTVASLFLFTLDTMYTFGRAGATSWTDITSRHILLLFFHTCVQYCFFSTLDPAKMFLFLQYLMYQIISRQIVAWNVPLVIIIIVIMMVRHAAFLVLGEHCKQAIKRKSILAITWDI